MVACGHTLRDALEAMLCMHVWYLARCHLETVKQDMGMQEGTMQMGIQAELIAATALVQRMPRHLRTSLPENSLEEHPTGFITLKATWHWNV